MIFRPKIISTSVYGKFYHNETIACYDGNIYHCHRYMMDKIKCGSLYELVVKGIRINCLGIYPRVIGFKFLHD